MTLRLRAEKRGTPISIQNSVLTYKNDIMNILIKLHRFRSVGWQIGIPMSYCEILNNECCHSLLTDGGYLSISIIVHLLQIPLFAWISIHVYINVNIYIFFK